MTTINEVIKRIDALSPNAYTSEQKGAWICEMDGHLRNLCHALGPVLTYPEDSSKALFVQPPHDRVYDCYVDAMMAFHNREMAAYNNAAALFEKMSADFQAWYIRTHTPDRAMFTT